MIYTKEEFFMSYMSMTIYNIYSFFIYYCLYCLHHNLFAYIVCWYLLKQGTLLVQTTLTNIETRVTRVTMRVRN